MRFGVVIFPGSNCDQDLIYVLENIYNQEVIRLWHKDTHLQGCDFILLPGGFSFGDYLRSGAIASFSPIMNSIIDFANNGGFVLGICNGFQILCESGLLPGTLLHNKTHKFICKNVFLSTQTNNSCITNKIDLNNPLCVPIAHAEGRFFADKKTLNKINDNDQVLFRYSDESGNISSETNLNGAVENIAGVCNINRNVFGMMPHPERAADKELNNTDGGVIFESIISVLDPLL